MLLILAGISSATPIRVAIANGSSWLNPCATRWTWAAGAADVTGFCAGDARRWTAARISRRGWRRWNLEQRRWRACWEDEWLFRLPTPIRYLRKSYSRAA